MFFSEVVLNIFLILGILLSLYEIYVKVKKFKNRNECIHLSHMPLPTHNRPIRNRKRQRKSRPVLRTPASFEGVVIN